ncbi:MAG: hypothetical protein WBD02_08710 [Acidimicrobiia bacterium]
MGFMDKVKDAAKVVGDKAHDIGEKAKDGIEDRKLSKQVEDDKHMIGDLVFRSKHGEEIPDLDAEIDRLVAEIVELQERIALEPESGAGPAPEAEAADAPDGASPSA